MENHHHINPEVEKIALILNVKESDVRFLTSHPHEQLEFLRKSIIIAIQTEQSGVWAPFGKVTRFIPNFMNAKVSEEILGPHITANITYHVNAKDAVSISNYYSISFFADVMEHVIPEKVEHILEAAAPEKMKQVLLELLKRKNYAQISALMDYTPVEKAAKITLEVKDTDIVSDVAYYSTKKSRLWEILRTYSDERNKNFIKSCIKFEREELLEEIIAAGDSNFQKKFRLLF